MRGPAPTFPHVANSVKRKLSSRAMNTVTLYDLVGTALVILRPTGIAYLNQVGGTVCDQRCAEGVLVPIGNDVAVPSLALMSLETPLMSYFFGPPWNGAGAVRGLTTEDADVIDGLLRSNGAFAGITTDRGRLPDSCEAWVYVSINKDSTVLFDGLGPTFPDHAILTWSNTD